MQSKVREYNSLIFHLLEITTVHHGIAYSIIMSLYPVNDSVQTGLNLFSCISLICSIDLNFLGVNPMDGRKIVSLGSREITKNFIQMKEKQVNTSFVFKGFMKLDNI